MRLPRALRYRSFALLWCGQTASALGDAVYGVALAWYVLRTTGSASTMGGVFLAGFAPMLLLLLLGGVAVDRVPRVRIMLASDVLRGCVVAAVAILAAQNRLTIWEVYLASLLFGTVRAFFFPAYTAVIPDLVPADILPSANGMTNVSGELSGVVGPVLSALLVAWNGPASAFALDALSFVGSAACLLAIRGVPALEKGATRASSALHEAGEGLRLVLRSPWLWLTIAIAGLINVTESGPRNVVLPFLVREALHAGVGAFGLVNALWSAGFILASVGMAHMRRPSRPGLVAYAGWLVAGLTALVVGLPVSLAGVAIAMLLWGAGVAVFDVLWTSILQTLVPRDLMGRVASIDALGSFALIPVGFALAGVASDRIGPAAVFVLGGAISSAVIALAMIHPAIRNLQVAWPMMPASESTPSEGAS